MKKSGIRQLEARCIFMGVIDERKFYEVCEINYGFSQISIYLNKDKTAMIDVPFTQCLELRFKNEGSLFDEI